MNLSLLNANHPRNIEKKLIEELSECIMDNDIVLDIGFGCGSLGYLVKLFFEYQGIFIIGIDVDSSKFVVKGTNIYDHLVLASGVNLPFRSVDVAFAVEIIEHIEHFEGQKMLMDLSVISKNVIVSTPEYGRRSALHLSAWKESDFVNIFKYNYSYMNIEKEWYNDIPKFMLLFYLLFGFILGYGSQKVLIVRYRK